jgi:hypothetical protein
MDGVSVRQCREGDEESDCGKTQQVRRIPSSADRFWL